MATTWSPARRAEESPNVAIPGTDSPAGRSSLRIATSSSASLPTTVGRHLGAVSQRDGQLLGARDDVGVRDDVPSLVDDEPGTGSGGDQRVAVDASSICWAPSMPSLSGSSSMLGCLRRLRCPQHRELVDAGNLGQVGEAFDPGEPAQIGLTDRLQVQDGHHRGIRLLRDVGDGHLGRLRRCRGAKRGAGPAVDHRLRGDAVGRMPPGRTPNPALRAEDQRRRQCPGQGHPAQAAYPLSGHASAPLLSTEGTTRPATDTEVTGPGGGKARPAPPPGRS